MTVEQIAQVAHEANRAYCLTLGDDSQPPWEEAPGWQRESAINGVQYHLDNPEANAQDSHMNWVREKEADGWIVGEVKDEDQKTHPCMVPWNELPEKQRRKGSLFIAVVRALAPSHRAEAVPEEADQADQADDGDPLSTGAEVADRANIEKS